MFRAVGGSSLSYKDIGRVVCLAAGHSTRVGYCYNSYSNLYRLSVIDAKDIGFTVLIESFTRF